LGVTTSAWQSFLEIHDIERTNLVAGAPHYATKSALDGAGGRVDVGLEGAIVVVGHVEGLVQVVKVVSVSVWYSSVVMLVRVETWLCVVEREAEHDTGGGELLI
jgi:hypothetical protein